MQEKAFAMDLQLFLPLLPAQIESKVCLREAQLLTGQLTNDT
jgi:hypothetical protein